MRCIIEPALRKPLCAELLRHDAWLIVDRRADDLGVAGRHGVRHPERL